jgi:hypothetical protein
MLIVGLLLLGLGASGFFILLTRGSESILVYPFAGLMYIGLGLALYGSWCTGWTVKARKARRPLPSKSRSNSPAPFFCRPPRGHRTGRVVTSEMRRLLMLGQGIAGGFQPNSIENSRPRLLVGCWYRVL